MLTFLFTDIADSTHLWQQFPQEMSHAAAAHDEILRRRIPEHHGRVVKSTGDGVLAVFERIADAARAGIAIQGDLRRHSWGDTGPLLVRMGLNAGDAELSDGDYYGTPVNKAARITALAAGGQMLLSDTAHALLQEAAGSEFDGRQLGAFHLKGLAGRTTIYQLLHPDLPAAFPPLPGGEATPTNLPAGLTSFVGRQREIAQIRDYLLDSESDPTRRRLVTLVGPGGTGKTRLSIQVAGSLLDAFPDGVWLLELAPIKEPERIPTALLDVLGLTESPHTPARTLIGSYLRDRQALLIFDNCEHLIDAAAQLVERIVNAAPMVQVLASSREGLGVPGETVLRIPSLPTPQSDAESWDAIRNSAAVQLFIARAEAAGAGGRLTPESGPAIAEICRRLDGIPLAIEMAAARLRVFSPAQILQRLDDRFRLLTGGSRTALPRQQTLQALIDWSYNLLSGEEQALFQELSVFAGGWTLEMALDVWPEWDVYALLPQLVDKSLVVAEPQGDGTRYRFLETMHQYARDRLLASGRAPEVRDRHLAYFVSFSQPGPLWISRADEPFRARVAQDIENLRAALTWGLETGPLSALELAANLGDFWLYGPLREGSRWIDSSLARVEGAGQPSSPATIAGRRLTLALARAYLVRSDIMAVSGLSELAGEAAKKGIAYSRLLDLLLLLIQAYIQHAISSVFYDPADGHASLQAALTQSAELPDQFLHALAMAVQGVTILTSAGDAHAARAYVEAALAQEPKIFTLSSGGLIAYIIFERLSGNWERARQLAEEGLRDAEASVLPASKRLLLAYQAELAHIERQTGNLDAALNAYARLIVAYRELSMEPAAANILECCGMIAVERGQYARAGQLFGAAEALRQRLNEDMAPYELMEYGPALARLRALADPATQQQDWQRGRAMNLDQAIELAGQTGQVF